jgi:hypothetical protein
MYYSEAHLRNERRRRLMYLLFGASMFLTVAICSTILFLMLNPATGRREVGVPNGFTVGEVSEVAVDRLELSRLLPNSPRWSEDIVFVVKQPDNSYQAFLGLDPVSGCKLNWRDQERRFNDSCTGINYNITGFNVNGVSTLESRVQHMIELPTVVQNNMVYVLDQRVLRDRN